MKRSYARSVAVACFVLLTCAGRCGAEQGGLAFRYSPPEWQCAICLPDDPQKSLVDKSGELLYDFGRGGREFATRIGVDVASNSVWESQTLLSPRVPIVRTRRSAGGLRIVEEAFALTESRPAAAAGPLLRVDGGDVLRGWARPGPGTDPALGDCAVHVNGAIRFVAAGRACRVALALCEGWWDLPGKRRLKLCVEGAPAREVDTVADIGKNKAALYWFDGKDADGDGRVEISVEPLADRNAILNGLWIYPEGVPTAAADPLSGKAGPSVAAALADAACEPPTRGDAILVRVDNPGAAPQTVRPRLIIDTTRALRVEGRLARVGGAAVGCSLGIAGGAEGNGARRALPLAEAVVPAGGTLSFFVLYGSVELAEEVTTVEQIVALRERAVQYWERAPLPWGRIEVPDARVQALLDSAVRNIWQAREIKGGLPAFQVGPTCYRGLWIVDGAFLLEAAAMLGAGDQARSGVAYELTHQREDGRIQVMKDFSKENGIVLWTCVRHAQLTQDKAWLESVWPKLARVAQHIQALRRETAGNASTLDDGLVPAGFPDGGIGGVHDEYTNPYWNLIGLRAFAGAARWLGKADEAAAWQKEYEAFMAAFRTAAARDMRADARGNRFLPILMGEAAAKELPQRGQWGFCHAVYPGQLFDQADPLVAGNLAMLRATEREGMVYGTGWDATGIWNYFASFYGHAWLWQGDGAKAEQALEAFADHAAPVLVWREEQSLCGEKFKKVGDMPHNWASAEFIRLCVHLLALDRGEELHLFEGFPAAWARLGCVTRLKGLATPFGALSMELKVAEDGASAELRVSPLSERSCKRIVVHLAGWANAEGADHLDLDPKEESRRTIHLRRTGAERK